MESEGKTKKRKKQKKNRKKKSKKDKTTKAKNIPAIKAYDTRMNQIRTSTTKNGDIQMSGRDRLGVVEMPLNITAENTVLFECQVNPRMFKVTSRLSDIAGNWEKYRFTKFVVDYIPNAPTTINGQLIMSFDPDPDGEIVGVDYQAMAESAMSRSRSVAMSITERKRLPMNCSPRLGINDWFVDDDRGTTELKFVSQSKFQVSVSTPLVSAGTLTDGLTVGSLYVDWSIILKQPQKSNVNGPITVDRVSEFLNWEYWGNLLSVSTTNYYVTAGTSQAYTDGFYFFDQNGNRQYNKQGGYVGDSATTTTTKNKYIADMINGQMYVVTTGWDTAPTITPYRGWKLTGSRIAGLLNKIFLFTTTGQQLANTNDLEGSVTTQNTGYMFGMTFVPNEASNIRIGYVNNLTTTGTKTVKAAGNVLQGQVARALLHYMHFPADSPQNPQLSMQDEMEQLRTELADMQMKFRALVEAVGLPSESFEALPEEPNSLSDRDYLNMDGDHGAVRK